MIKKYRLCKMRPSLFGSKSIKFWYFIMNVNLKSVDFDSHRTDRVPTIEKSIDIFIRSQQLTRPISETSPGEITEDLYDVLLEFDDIQEIYEYLPEFFI